MSGRLHADNFEITFKFRMSCFNEAIQKLRFVPTCRTEMSFNIAKRNEESNFMRVLPDKERPEVLVEQRLMFEENC